MTRLKSRLDLLLVEKGLVASRTEAQSIIMAGKVFINDQRVDKCGIKVEVDTQVTIKNRESRFVSRGGLKLEAAIEFFGIPLMGKSAIDIGASTGGFTDCLLSRGAERVFCLDVGHGQLAEKIRNDKRVYIKDRFNARYLKPGDLPWPCNLAVIDVSFISLKMILAPLWECLSDGSIVIALVKPQFEVGKGMVGKGGIVKDEILRIGAVEGIEKFASGSGFTCKGRMESPVRGMDGNVEYFLYLITNK